MSRRAELLQKRQQLEQDLTRRRLQGQQDWQQYKQKWHEKGQACARKATHPVSLALVGAAGYWLAPFGKRGPSRNPDQDYDQQRAEPMAENPSNDEITPGQQSAGSEASQAREQKSNFAKAGHYIKVLVVQQAASWLEQRVRHQMDEWMASFIEQTAANEAPAAASEGIQREQPAEAEQPDEVLAEGDGGHRG